MSSSLTCIREPNLSRGVLLMRFRMLITSMSVISTEHVKTLFRVLTRLSSLRTYRRHATSLTCMRPLVWLLERLVKGEFS